MGSNRKIISDIRSMNKLLSSDAMITDRVIYGEAKSASLLLIKRDTDRRRLWQSPNLFDKLQCLEMEECPLAECCEYTSPCNIARSKLEIPKIAEGIFGLLIQMCSSVDNSTKFTEVTPSRYANILKLGLRTKKVYFWIFNRHVYVSNPDTKAVNFFAFFEEDIPNSLLFPDNCPCTTNISPCTSILDQEFKCPGYLEKTVKDMVAEGLLKKYFNTGIDKTSDNKDDTSKD